MRAGGERVLPSRSAVNSSLIKYVLLAKHNMNKKTIRVIIIYENAQKCVVVIFP